MIFAPFEMAKKTRLHIWSVWQTQNKPSLGSKISCDRNSGGFKARCAYPPTGLTLDEIVQGVYHPAMAEWIAAAAKVGCSVTSGDIAPNLFVLASSKNFCVTNNHKNTRLIDLVACQQLTSKQTSLDFQFSWRA